MPGARLLLLVAAGLAASAARGEALGPEPAPPAAEGPRWVAAPFARYAPETAWGFGAISLLWFHSDAVSREAGRVSAVAIAGQYTTRAQAAGGLQWDLYLGEGTWRAAGTLLAERWPYEFWGVGEAATRASEPYTARTARLEGSLLRRAVAAGEGKGLWVGARLAARHDRIGAVDPGGRLDACAVAGCGGGRTVLLQGVAAWDTRDQVFAPTGGLLLSAQLGGAPGFTQADLDARAWIPVPLLPGAVLALQARLGATAGEVPFYLQPSFGGDRSLRGVVDGRHRDLTAGLIQAELAAPLVWRLGFEVFGGAGGVAPRPSALPAARIVPAGGLGLRFLVDRADRVMLRLDHAWSPGESHWYLSIGQNI